MPQERISEHMVALPHVLEEFEKAIKLKIARYQLVSGVSTFYGAVWRVSLPTGCVTVSFLICTGAVQCSQQ